MLYTSDLIYKKGLVGLKNADTNLKHLAKLEKTQFDTCIYFLQTMYYILLRFESSNCALFNPKKVKIITDLKKNSKQI